MKLTKEEVLAAALSGKPIQSRARGETNWHDHMRYMDFSNLMGDRIEVRLKPRTETKQFCMGLYGQGSLKPNIKIVFKDGKPISSQVIEGDKA